MSFYFYVDDAQFYVSLKSSISGDLSRARSTLEARARDIDKLMLCNQLKLNGDKTELLIFHAKRRPAPFFDQVQAASKSVTSSASAKNMGIFLDSTLSLDKHVTQICKSLFYSIRNISRIDRCPRICYLKLENCNSLLYGLSKNLLQRLQYICFELCS